MGSVRGLRAGPVGEDVRERALARTGVMVGITVRWSPLSACRKLIQITPPGRLCRPPDMDPSNL
jgi:hypothetical protein